MKDVDVDGEILGKGKSSAKGATNDVEQKCTDKENNQEECINSVGRGGGSNISLCTCRICQTFKSKEALISPCNCKGTLGKVHLSCLERWLNMCGKQHCEICRFQFKAKLKRRYGLLQSARIWVRHPAHRMLLKSDLIVASILTTVALGLGIVTVFGLKYFVEEGQKIGVPSGYTEGVLIMFLMVIIIGYLTVIYLMAKDHVISWYRWWSRCMIIKIILNTTSQQKLDENMTAATGTTTKTPTTTITTPLLTPSSTSIALLPSPFELEISNTSLAAPISQPISPTLLLSPSIAKVEITTLSTASSISSKSIKM